MHNLHNLYYKREGHLRLILGLAVMLIGCQPSNEEQAKRELAVEAEMEKQKQSEAINNILDQRRADIKFIQTLQRRLAADKSPEAAASLKILDACIEKEKFDTEAKACYLKLSVD